MFNSDTLHTVNFKIECNLSRLASFHTTCMSQEHSKDPCKISNDRLLKETNQHYHQDKMEMDWACDPKGF